ncbi:hypothetical protein [Planococcus beigongshangi]|uniref:hypothetical protein n=1 Tax=Planococcus beigongshangi TaxID=2782536 RepID=UPI00193BEB4C|nr:hypothetical protein [Planococcus beigongshangi]
MDNETLNIEAWQLKYLAQALTRGKRLEVLRAKFHEELYECISYSTTNFDPLNPKGIKTATDSQAIRIIEAKERYDRMIMNEYDRHFRWQLLLDWLTDHDRTIMVRYFQKKKFVRPELIASLLHRISKRLAEEERHIEKVRTDQAKEEYAEYAKATAEKRMPKRKLSVFEDGKWILIDPDEYNLLQWKKRLDAKQKDMREYFKDNFNHPDAL